MTDECAPSGKKLAYGGVVIDNAGRVLLREPKGHYGGYVWTFPKGGADPGEAPEAAALREVLEETGWRAQIVEAIPGWFGGDTSATKLYLMRPVEDTGVLDGETSQVRWVPLDEAAGLLGSSTTKRGRERDLQVLSVVRSMLGARGTQGPGLRDELG